MHIKFISNNTELESNRRYTWNKECAKTFLRLIQKMAKLMIITIKTI